MRPGRSTYLLLAVAVVVSAVATASLAPEGPGGAPCGLRQTTLAVEVCPPPVVTAILGKPGSEVRRSLHEQTLVDFALVASYVGLWGATGLALHPAVALLAAAAGAADVIENLGILHELSLDRALPLVQWAGLTKWWLLGVVFVAFAFLFRPDRPSGGWRPLLRAATGLAYGVAGLAFLAGLYDPRFVEWGTGPMVVAVLLQLVLHAAAHAEFAALGNQRGGSEPEPATASLSVERVLREEYECLRGPGDPAPVGGGLPALYEAIHGLADKRAALCLSGGGIRSATFALGVMQGLAKVLPRFHYLSTVSGGGYIGGWLTAWLHHSGNDAARVAAELARLDPTNKLDPEPSPISQLRDYSNYLAPRPGLLSADTWTLVGTISRNLLLVWAVLVPLLAAALIVPRLYLALVQNRPDAAEATALGGRLLLGLGAIALAWAVAYIGASIPSSTTAPRGQDRFLGLCLVPLLIAVLCLTLYWAWWPARDWGYFVGFGVVVHLGAWAGYTVWLLTPWGHGRRLAQWRRSPEKAALATLAELVVVVVAGAAAGFIAWYLANLLFDDGGQLGRFTLLYAPLAPGVFLGSFLLAATLLVGFLSRWTDDDDREWWARCGSWMLIAGTVWMGLSALVLFGPLVFSKTVLGTLVASLGGVSGLVSLVGGWSARSAATSTPAPASGLAATLGRLGLPGAAAVFAAVLLIVMSLLTSGLLGLLMKQFGDLRLSGPVAPQWPEVPNVPLDHVSVLLVSSPLLVVLVGGGLGLLGAGVAWLVNTNKFSLHAMYRARLIRAYLGASDLDRHANPFTGFDPADNIQLHELWPNPPAGPGPAPRRALFHVVNMALNLVHGDRLAWQERKAHSFTMSPLHAGSLAVGEAGAYRRTRAKARAPRGHYGGRRGVSLGTAITISGAAASPNMGYHSSSLVTFLMTFFNARLGWWLGNPGPAGEKTFYLSSPRFTIRPIVAEAFGLTDRTSPYVYLSDGGHFDNLGLYEMVLRRCHFIVVSDAGCDGPCRFNDLGGAIRKIRADLGIPIEFPRGIPIYSRSVDPATRAHGQYWAVGRIRYSAVDLPGSESSTTADARDGWLLYLKPAFYGSEPPDVYEYAMTCEQFPHESTVDQFFSESQFESYRMLGRHAVERLCGGWTGDSIADLVRHADARDAERVRPA